MYRFLRCFLCLLVVCCLIINLSPIKANAVDPFSATAFVAVGAAVAVAAAFQALGVMAGESPVAFNDAVNNCVSYLKDTASYIVDGMVTVLGLSDGGAVRSFLMKDLIQDCYNWLFTSQTLTSSYTWNNFITNHAVSSYAEALSYAQHCLGAYVGTDVTGVRMIVITNPSSKYCTFTDGTLKINVNYLYYSKYVEGSASFVKSTGSGYHTFYDMVELSTSPVGVALNDNFTLGLIQAPIVESSSSNLEDLDVYADYLSRAELISGASSDDGDDQDPVVPWLPVGIPSLEYGEITYGQTQYEAQTGETVIDFDFGTSSDPVGDSTDYSSLIDKIIGFLTNIWDSIKELPSKFATWFEAIIEGIAALPGKFATWFETIIEDIQALPGKFATWFETIIDGIQAIPDVISGWFVDVIEWLTSIWEAICSIPTLILDGITAIFVPSEDFVTTKVEALRERFSWIEPILGYGDYIKAQFIDPVPPVVYVHLGDAEGSYNYGGTVKFLDMSWYERYKSQGDAIISGFLWALFAWRMYVKLPGIINGVAGDVGHISYGESAWQKAEARKERKEKGGKNK